MQCTHKPVSACLALRHIPMQLRTSSLPTRKPATACRASAVSIQAVSRLLEAARNRSVPPEEAEQLLTQVETEAGASPPGLDQIVPGKWRLIYSSNSKIRQLQYIPITEDFIIDTANSAVSLDSVVGPFAFTVRGKLFGWSASTGELEFQFNKGVGISFLGKQVWEVKTSGSRKVYRFFHFSSHGAGAVSAARSSAGGLSLLARLPL